MLRKTLRINDALSRPWEMVERHTEHCEDAEQFDVGISPPLFAVLECAGAIRLACVPVVVSRWVPAGVMFSSSRLFSKSLFLIEFYMSEMTSGKSWLFLGIEGLYCASECCLRSCELLRSKRRLVGYSGRLIT